MQFALKSVCKTVLRASVWPSMAHQDPRDWAPMPSILAVCREAHETGRDLECPGRSRRSGLRCGAWPHTLPRPAAYVLLRPAVVGRADRLCRTSVVRGVQLRWGWEHPTRGGGRSAQLTAAALTHAALLCLVVGRSPRGGCRTPPGAGVRRGRRCGSCRGEVTAARRRVSPGWPPTWSGPLL